MFCISDTGIGIPKDKLAVIFNKFTQIKGEVGSFNGTGLGLPIVKNLLSLYDAKIKVESEKNKGSKFYFTIELKQAKLKKIKKNKPLITEIIPSRYHIHIVEDNHINQIVTKKVLLNKGFRCSVSQNGWEAIENVKNHDYDLVLMDINMPGIDGIETAKRIKKVKPQLIIIALTASDDTVVKNKIYESGMSDLIIKPYDVQYFHQIILKNILNIKKHIVS